jgi:raffinose/stachyose/melibiose transport system permease protein
MDKMLRDPKTILFFVGPALLVFLLFIPVPAISSIILSLTRWDLIGEPRFIGLSNYIFMVIDDYVIQRAFRNTLIFVGLSILLQLPMAFLLANILGRGLRGRHAFRNFIFLPVTFSSVAVSLMFYFIYHPNVGLLNQALGLLGVESTFPWLGDTRTALVAVIFTLAWQWTGYHMVIYLAGISTIDQDLFDAAEIDGCNAFQVSRHVIFPLLIPVLQVSTVLITVSSLKSFDQIFVMTSGGPNHASEVIASHMYTKTFAQLKYGYGSALSTLLMTLCIAGTLLINALYRRGRRQVEER